MAPSEKSETTEALVKREPTGFAIVDEPQAKTAMVDAFDQLGITDRFLNHLWRPLGLRFFST